jgi:hypothetical protein
VLKYLSNCVYIIEHSGSIPTLKIVEFPKCTFSEFLARKWFND